MDEAEQLCDRIAILERGEVAALDTPQGLIASYGGQVRVIFSTDRSDLSWLEGVSHVTGITRESSRVEVKGTGPVLALVAAALVDHDIAPDDLRVERPTLEDVFLKLTGHAILD
jgi:ABC-2 type transport system ATP-binding protein